MPCDSTCAVSNPPTKRQFVAQLQAKGGSRMIVGTAGHIDHGKTTLVRALSGVDTDRLKEEKARGISIELGYAYVPLDNGNVLGLIDVPGHEKLVHTMAAGASGIDFALLVIAADDGVMPQTREHLAILESARRDAGRDRGDQDRSRRRRALEGSTRRDRRRCSRRARCRTRRSSTPTPRAMTTRASPRSTRICASGRALAHAPRRRAVPARRRSRVHA